MERGDLVAAHHLHGGEAGAPTISARIMSSLQADLLVVGGDGQAPVRRAGVDPVVDVAGALPGLGADLIARGGPELGMMLSAAFAPKGTP